MMRPIPSDSEAAKRMIENAELAAFAITLRERAGNIGFDVTKQVTANEITVFMQRMLREMAADLRSKLHDPMARDEIGKQRDPNQEIDDETEGTTNEKGDDDEPPAPQQ